MPGRCPAGAKHQVPQRPTVPTTGKPRPSRCAWDVVEAQSLQMGLELLLICRVGLMFHHLSTSGSNIAQQIWVSLWKCQKNHGQSVKIIIFPQKLLAFFWVSLGSPNPQWVLGFPDVGWCPCHRCAQRRTSEPTWHGLPSPPRPGLRPHFYQLMAYDGLWWWVSWVYYDGLDMGWKWVGLWWVMTRGNYLKITDCYQFCRVWQLVITSC